MSNPTVDAQPGMRPPWRAGAVSLGAPAARCLFWILNESQNWKRSFCMYLLRHYNRSTYSCPWYGYKISPETSINITKSSWTQGGLNHVQHDCRIVAAFQIKSDEKWSNKATQNMNYIRWDCTQIMQNQTININKHWCLGICAKCHGSVIPLNYGTLESGYKMLLIEVRSTCTGYDMVLVWFEALLAWALMKRGISWFQSLPSAWCLQ